LVGLKENHEMTETAKARLGQVLSIVYIKEPTVDWYYFQNFRSAL
jgi:hypothetical protein